MMDKKSMFMKGRLEQGFDSLREDENKIISIIFPKEIFFYYENENKICNIINEIFTGEKEKIDKIINGFLKNIIVESEKIKKTIFEKLDLSKKNYLNFFSNFKNRIKIFHEEICEKLIDLNNYFKNCLNKIDLNRNDLLNKELQKMKLKKNRIEEKEKFLKENIKIYKNSQIPNDKKILDDIIAGKIDTENYNFYTIKKNLQKINGELQKILNIDFIINEKNNLNQFSKNNINQFSKDKNIKQKQFSKHNIIDFSKNNLNNHSKYNTNNNSNQFSKNNIEDNLNHFSKNNINDNSKNISNNYSKNISNNSNSNNLFQSLAPRMIYRNGFNGERLRKNIYSKKNDKERISFLDLDLSKASSSKREIVSKKDSIDVLRRNSDKNNLNAVNKYRFSLDGSKKKGKNDKNEKKSDYYGLEIKKNKNYLNSDKKKKFQKNFNKNININIQNVKQNTKFISIFKNKDQKRNILSSKKKVARKKITKRPLSSSVFKSFSKDPNKKLSKINLSIKKTNLVTKDNLVFKNIFFEKILNYKKINCFDIVNNENILILGTEDGFLVKCKFNENLEKFEELKKIKFMTSIKILKNFDNSNILLYLKNEKLELLLLDLKSLKIIKKFKLLSKIKILKFSTNDFFIIFCEDEKFYLYNNKIEKALKSFRIKNSKIIDILLISEKKLLIVLKKGEIKILEINSENKKIKIVNYIKLNLKINYIDSFHKNEKLLLVNGIKNNKNLILIINLENNSIMNNIFLEKKNDFIFSTFSFSIIKNPPEIFLFAFDQNGNLFFNDIEKNVLKNKIFGDKLSFGEIGRNEEVKIFGKNNNHIFVIVKSKDCLNLVSLTN